jgi:hypothetical protein
MDGMPPPRLQRLRIDLRQVAHADRLGLARFHAGLGSGLIDDDQTLGSRSGVVAER